MEIPIDNLDQEKDIKLDISKEYFTTETKFGTFSRKEALSLLNKGAKIRDKEGKYKYFKEYSTSDTLIRETISSDYRELLVLDNNISCLPDDDYFLLSFGQLDGSFESTKIIDNLPCAHRQWRHEGHCKFIHGYSRSFHFWFGCRTLEEGTNFVYEFGSLKEVKKWLTYMFDHTCLINSDDPEIETFKDLHRKEIINLRVLPNVGMEATAKFVCDRVNSYIQKVTQGRAWINKIEVRENNKNSGIYRPTYC